MNEINVEIVTPSKTAYEGKIRSITIPGSLGSFQVLYNHAPLMSSFEPGKIKIVDIGGEDLEYATGGGTVEVQNNNVIVLAESFESPDEIDIDRAKKAFDRAKKRLARETDEKDIDMIRAEAALKRAINRLKITDSYKPS